MKNATLIAIAGTILVTGITYAQLPDSTGKDTGKPQEVLINTPKAITDHQDKPHRHPTADLILLITAKNVDHKDILIQYQDSEETAAYVKEIQEELVLRGHKVSTYSSPNPVPAYTGRQYVNCSYEISEDLFIVTAYPAKGE